MYLELLIKLPKDLIDFDHLIRLFHEFISKHKYPGNVHEHPVVQAILSQLYVIGGRYDLAGKLLIKRKDPSVFVFLKQHKVDIPLSEFFGKLLKIDSKATLDFILDRGESSQTSKDASKLIDNCMYGLNESFKNKRKKGNFDAAELEEEMERQKYTFLKTIFDKNKTLGRHYHTYQIELCIKYDRENLMDLLVHGDYEKMRALELCKSAKLFNEQAYLYLMIGNRDAAIKLLINNTGESIKDTLDLAVRFQISDD